MQTSAERCPGWPHVAAVMRIQSLGTDQDGKGKGGTVKAVSRGSGAAEWVAAATIANHHSMLLQFWHCSAAVNDWKTNGGDEGGGVTEGDQVQKESRGKFKV